MRHKTFMVAQQQQMESQSILPKTPLDAYSDFLSFFVGGGN